MLEHMIVEGVGLKLGVYTHTGLWLRTGCVTNAQVSVFERTGF